MIGGGRDARHDHSRLLWNAHLRLHRVCHVLVGLVQMVRSVGVEPLQGVALFLDGARGGFPVLGRRGWPSRCGGPRDRVQTTSFVLQVRAYHHGIQFYRWLLDFKFDYLNFCLIMNQFKTRREQRRS